MDEMKDLISNAAIIVAVMFLGGELCRNNELSPTAPLKNRVLAGMFMGLVGCALMLFSVILPPNVVLDLRHFALIVIAMHGGMIPTVITGLIMAFFRVAYFGINHTAVIGVISIISMTLLCSFIGTLKLQSNKKWLLINVVTMIAVSVTLWILFQDTGILLYALTYFWIIAGITGFGVVHVSNYIVASNELYTKYKADSTKDFLTGLNNVRQFDNILNGIISRTTLKQGKVSVLTVDIDHFKHVNDSYGHAAGDEVLKELANVLANACRSDDSISRIGGEEFCVVLPECGCERALEIGERIRKSVEHHIFPVPNNNLKITISVGVATFPDTVKSINEIMEEADKALYLAKQTGRNKVSLNI